MVEWLPAVHEVIGFFPSTPGKKEEKEKNPQGSHAFTHRESELSVWRLLL